MISYNMNSNEFGRPTKNDTKQTSLLSIFYEIIAIKIIYFLLVIW